MGDGMARVGAGSERFKRAMDGVQNAFKRVETIEAPRIWMTGGIYFGENDGQVVGRGTPNFEGYVDLWWTRDGTEWFQVNYEEGDLRVSNPSWTGTSTKYSSAESFKTTVSDQGTDVDIYLPKYGHTMLPFRPLDSKISALYFVAGDTATRLDGTRVNDVFQSQNGVFCEIKGHTCNRQGYCDPIENGLLDGEGGTVMSQQKGDFARAYSGGVVAKEISSADEAKRTMNSRILETNIT